MTVAAVAPVEAAMSTRRLHVMRTAAAQLPARYGVAALLLLEAVDHIEALQALLTQERPAS